jgi:hypothetical protein
MGEVWNARDTRLGRRVAVKVSKTEFSKRFEREARTIAALNHPNIAHIYDVGENYLVMEFVDGAPVRPTDDVRKLLDIALQIADGLSAAHSAGIVHRDLKPDNILLTRDGRIRILDFGLAKQESAAGSSVTGTMTMTDPGMVVGTVDYMSPEQARGRELDHRSDQFSFGLILYELAAGKRPFRRETAAETMTAIIRDEVEPLPSTVPAPVRWTIERCLGKEPDRRYDSTRDLYRELLQTREGLSQMLGQTAAVIGASPRVRSRWATVAVAAIAAGALLGMWLQSLRYSAPPAWAGVRLGGPAVALAPRVSPDGQMLALLTLVTRQTQVAILKPDGGSWRGASWNVLTHDVGNGSVTNLSWARDGSRLFFDRFWERPIRFRRLAENQQCCWRTDGRRKRCRTAASLFSRERRTNTTRPFGSGRTQAEARLSPPICRSMTPGRHCARSETAGKSFSLERQKRRASNWVRSLTSWISRHVNPAGSIHRRLSTTSISS